MYFSSMKSKLKFRICGTGAGRAAISLLAVGASGALLSGCSTKAGPEPTPTVTVQVDAAEKEAISRHVITDAVLYPRDQAAIVPKGTLPSPVKKWFVERGAHVKPGQLLVELENEDVTGAAQKSQGGLVQAQVAYEMQMQKSAQDLKAAKQTLDSAQKFYDGRVALLKEGAVSAKDVDDAAAALTAAKNQYELTQKQYDLKSAEGAFNAAKGDAANTKAALDYTKITSPIAGVVTDRPFYPGETPPVGAPVVTVMDTAEVVARAHISQNDAASLKVGNPASITIPGQPGEDKGRITLISPAVDANSTTVEVWVQAPNPKGRLRPGSSVRVSMVGETVPQAVVIPTAALLTAPDGTHTVITLDDQNTPNKAKVEVGIRDGQNVQVTKGLQGGERVVTVGAFELAAEDDPVLAKTKIQVQAPKMPDEEE